MYRVGIIGTGKPWRAEGATGHGMSHKHAEGYKQAGDCQLVAVCDLVEENARAFADQHGDGNTKVYTDYHAMLQAESLDIVSVCTWPALHAPMVIACAEAGTKAIHCEKPMATTWGEAKRMAQACADHGVQLTFNHQRRFNKPFRRAKELKQAGAIGELQRIEMICGNLYDWGTHWFDMAFMMNDETPALWMLGQVEVRGAKPVFGVPIENQGVAYWKWQNGVHGHMMTGFETPKDAQIRLVGTTGTIEIGAANGVSLRIRTDAAPTWETIETGDTLHGDQANYDGVIDLVEALRTGREPELSARRALQATELIFATYESARRRGRVELPLTIEDSPIEWLIQAVA